MTHQQLWAPWRLSYITNSADETQQTRGESEASEESAESCFLCRYEGEDPDKDAENLVVTRGESVITVLNRYPYNNGHLLVAPRAHLSDLSDLSSHQMLALMEEIQLQVLTLRKVLNAEGFNVGLNLGRVSGAGLPGHLHWHIVPRWNGDTNFMPVLADVKVIPQSLEALYGLLREELFGAQN